MLTRLHIDGVELPRLYVAKNNQDIRIARKNGFPYIVWKQEDTTLLKLVLRPTLERLFPYIKWDKILGKKRFKTRINISTTDTKGSEPDPSFIDEPIKEDILIEDKEEDVFKFEENKDISNDKEEEHIEDASITTSARTFHGSSDEGEYATLSLEEYIGDISSSVNIDVIQSLGMLPKFIGDIVDCIKVNINNSMRWKEGYTKKLGVPLGNFSESYALKNLIILDVSGSIPRGISATMISLIDTLRNQCNADLIITASISRFYPYGSELPDAQDIRSMFRFGNESDDFFDILRSHIFGHEYGHVISFGDFDEPSYQYLDLKSSSNTRVHQVHHYHTNRVNKTGYARWCAMVCPDVNEEYNISWCDYVVD